MPQIEVTPEMIEAGLRIFQSWEAFGSIALDELGREFPAALRASLECAARQQAERRACRD